MLESRSTEIEIMDDLSLQGEVIPQTLRELDRINQLLGGNAISLRAYKKLFSKEVMSVVDLGCGSGDLLIRLKAHSGGQSVQFEGIDANPAIADYARDHTRAHSDIRIEALNIFSTEFQAKSYDIIHCCLFLHHFTNEELIGLFRAFKTQARVGVIVNDLHRHFLAYYSIKWLTALFSKSYMVKADAATSVSRGFLKSELIQILNSAGINNYSLKWRWAFRWELIIYTGKK